MKRDLVLLLALLGLLCGVFGGTTPEPESTPEPEGEGEPEGEPEITPQMVADWIRANPEYMAMIGMGLMIILLTITAITVICCYAGSDRSGGYVKK